MPSKGSTGRKSKITAVPIEPKEQQTEVIEEKTDAEQMTDVLNHVNVADDEPLVAPSEPVVLKAVKAKRASRAKPKVPGTPVGEEPEVKVTSSTLDEAQVEVTIPEEAKTDAKVDTKVTCPDCGKQMSAKTLKYSHVPNCTAKKQSEGGSQARQRSLRTPAPEASLRREESVLEEVIENEVQKRLQNKRSERAARREEMVQKLMQNAF